MRGLYKKFGGKLDLEFVTLHAIFTEEPDWGLFRVISEGDSFFPQVMKEYYLNKKLYEEFDGFPIEYAARQKNIFSSPRLFNPPNTLAEVDTNKKIILPTELTFGRSFGHVSSKFYFFGSHSDFMQKLAEEGYGVQIPINQEGKRVTYLDSHDDLGALVKGDAVHMILERYDGKDEHLCAYHGKTSHGMLQFLKPAQIREEYIIMDRVWKSKAQIKDGKIIINEVGTATEAFDSHNPDYDKLNQTLQLAGLR